MPPRVGRGGLSSVMLPCLGGLIPLISGEHMLLLMLSTDLSLHTGKRWASVCYLFSELGEHLPGCLGASPTACSSILWTQEISCKVCEHVAALLAFRVKRVQFLW